MNACACKSYLARRWLQNSPKCIVHTVLLCFKSFLFIDNLKFYRFIFSVHNRSIQITVLVCCYHDNNVFSPLLENVIQFLTSVFERSTSRKVTCNLITHVQLEHSPPAHRPGLDIPSIRMEFVMNEKRRTALTGCLQSGIDLHWGLLS